MQGWGRRERCSKTPETMAAKVVEDLGIQTKLPGQPPPPREWEMLVQEEKSLFQHVSPGLSNLCLRANSPNFLGQHGLTTQSEAIWVPMASRHVVKQRGI